MNAGEFEEFLAHLDALVAGFEQHAEPDVRGRALELLQHVDTVHREGLSRLVEVVNRRHPQLLEEAARDPVVRLFLTLYDLEPPERAAGAFIPLQHLRQSAALAQTRRRTEP